MGNAEDIACGYPIPTRPMAFNSLIPVCEGEATSSRVQNSEKDIMTLSRFATLAAAAFVLTTTAYAQYPKDNNVYKMRCDLLAGQDSAIQSGSIPAVLAGASKGIPAAQIVTFAVDREKDGDHQVACVLFYMAAIASRAANQADDAKTYSVFAHTEYVKSTGGSPSFGEKLTRGKVEAAEIRKPALTSAQLTAIVDALNVMPISLTPPPAPKASPKTPAKKH